MTDLKPPPGPVPSNVEGPVSPGSPASASPKPMLPGEYIRKRRRAADLEIAAIAVEIAGPHLPAEDACRALFALEADQLPDGASRQHVLLIDSLQQALPFDAEVYWTLVAARVNPEAAVPAICRECGCTEWDPCVEVFGDPCAWADVAPGEAPLCTACDKETPDPAVGAPVPVLSEVEGAAAGEIRHAA